MVKHVQHEQGEQVEVDRTSVKRLTKDLKLAAKSLTDVEARFLVDAYYMMQEDRKRSDNQVRALGESAEPNSVLAWFAEESGVLEQQIKRALDAYTDGHPMGSWMKQIVGIGPVISAGLLAHLSLTPWRCRNTEATKSCRSDNPCTVLCGREIIETVGHWWRFAGLDPTSKWEKGQKRPWNAQLKTLCWKLGQSFMKFSGKPDCFYGLLYKERKVKEWEKNVSGGQAVRATALLEKVGKTTEAWAWYAGCYAGSSVMQLRKLKGGESLTSDDLKKIRLPEGHGTPMLPPGQIDGMARRWAVKLFLAHLHDAWYRGQFGKEPPLPYPIAFLGHADVIHSNIAPPAKFDQPQLSS